MNIYTKVMRAFSVTVLVAIVGVAEPALAQIEEIIVTARKREESLQNVPIAVTSMSEDVVEKAHVSTVADLDKLLPNVDLGDNPFAGQALNANIRGIGFSDPEKSYEPVVGFSIDGVFLGFNTGAAIDAFDIENIEVLRGPQGTLYGRNTVGGAINVTRSRPTEESGLKLKTRITDGGGRELFAVGNLGKLGDTVSTKVYAFKREDETFAENVVTGENEDQTDILSYGAAFLIEPNDSFEALLSIDAFDDQSAGAPTYNLSAPGDLFCDLPNLDFLNSIGVPGVPDIFPFVVDAAGSQSGCGTTSIDVAEDSDFELFARGTPFITNIEGSSVSLNIEYQLNDDLLLTSITGYRETEEHYLGDGLGGPNLTATIEVAPGVIVPLEFPLFYTNRNQETEQFSQELRISGDLGDNLDFVSGIYYLDSEYQLAGGEYPDGSFGVQQAFGGIADDRAFDQQTTAYAIFADGSFDITDELILSAGLRYSKEEKEVDIEFINSSAADVIGTSASESEEWSSTTGRLILQYALSDDAMVYGGYSRGFRSGGFNGRAGTVDGIGPYDPETVDSFELGLRAEFFDNRVRFNPTVFMSDYSDKQEESQFLRFIGASTTPTTQTIVQNASEAEIKGIEVEILAQLTDDLTLTAALGLIDAEFSEFLAPANPFDLSSPLVDVSDQRNLRAGPEENLSIGFNYSWPLDDAQLVVNTLYFWQDETVTSASSDPLGLGRDRVGSENALDISITYETLRDGTNFSITAFGNDITDDRAGRLASSIVIPNVFSFGAGAPTRVFGVEATVEF